MEFEEDPECPYRNDSRHPKNSHSTVLRIHSATGTRRDEWYCQICRTRIDRNGNEID